MLTCERLLAFLDDRIPALLSQQVMDRSRKNFGGFNRPGYSVVEGGHIESIMGLGMVWLFNGSRFYRSDEILERLLLAAQFARAVRRPSGLFDLATTDWDSGPYTGFLVQAIAPVVRAARKSDAPGASDVAEALGEIIHTAAPGMARGGFNTPNHRWVLVGALAQALDLFPDLDVMPAIDAYLAETIDINADGEYTERSTGVYNAICNRSLRLAAECLGRADLLDPVRKNLDTSYHMLHADGTVVTSLSRRQDRGSRTVPVGMVDSYYSLARIDDNGFYAAVADWLSEFELAAVPWSLEPFLTHPEYRTDAVVREALPDTYRKVYPVSGVCRVRRGKMSATAATGITAPFSLKYGQVELTAVKVSGCYFGMAQFRAETMADEDGRIVLRFPGRGSRHAGPIYSHPLGRPVSMDEYARVWIEREVTVLPPLEMQLAMAEVAGGFDLRLKTSEPFDNIPLQIEFDFAPGGTFDFEDGAFQGAAGQTFLLRQGVGVYHVENDAISIGPGAYAHRMWQMRGSEPAPDAFRVLTTFTTPVDCVVEIRCGTWQEATLAIQ